MGENLEDPDFGISFEVWGLGSVSGEDDADGVGDGVGNKFGILETSDAFGIIVFSTKLFLTEMLIK